MSSKSETYQVFVASPSDLGQERKIVVEAIEDWNAQHALAEGVVLLPVMWETHARPESGVRPQEAINRQLVDRCDILVGIFWNKIGTDTGVAESGTVEEIEEFVAQGKPALLYFSDCPIAPSKIDLTQRAKLDEFKTVTRQRALTGSFGDHNELRQRLVRDLLRQVREMKAKGALHEERPELDRPPATLLRQQREQEYGVRDRIKESLLDKRFKWRSLNAVLREAGVSKDHTDGVLLLLRTDPSVRFTTGKSGEVLVGLRSRVDRVELGDARRSYPEHGDRWGKWEFDSKALVLNYLEEDDGYSRYEIDLETITSSAEMLDWIFQIAGKAWASPEDLGNLVSAFDDLIRPQANLCSWGHDKQLDVTKLLREHIKTREML